MIVSIVTPGYNVYLYGSLEEACDTYRLEYFEFKDGTPATHKNLLSVIERNLLPVRLHQPGKAPWTFQLDVESRYHLKK